MEGATRKELYRDKSDVIEKNHKVFKGTWETYIKANMFPSQEAKLRGYVDKVSESKGATKNKDTRLL